jgi:hypothetical protein
MHAFQLVDGSCAMKLYLIWLLSNSVMICTGSFLLISTFCAEIEGLLSFASQAASIFHATAWFLAYQLFGILPST